MKKSSSTWIWTQASHSTVRRITLSAIPTHIIMIMTLFVLFFRCFGPKCGGCGEKIHYQDFVRKAREKVYHLRCFTCSICAKQLSTGEVLYMQPGDDGFVCRDHYLKQGKHQRFIFLKDPWFQPSFKYHFLLWSSSLWYGFPQILIPWMGVLLTEGVCFARVRGLTNIQLVCYSDTSYHGTGVSNFQMVDWIHVH